MTEFAKRVYTVVGDIPPGCTMSYKAVAEAAGKPRAFRAVGNILNKNIDPAIPCHRVIKSSGQAGGYNRGEDRKVILLRMESHYGA